MPAAMPPRTSSDDKPDLIRFFWSHRRSFAPGLLFALARILSIASFPLIFKDILDHRMPQKDLRGILVLGGVMLGLLFLHQWLSVSGARRLGKAVTNMVLRLRAEIFDKIQTLSFTYLDRQQTGRLLAKYSFDTQKIEGIALPVLNSFIPDSLYSLLMLGVLVWINWQLAAVILLMLPVIAIMRTRYFERLRQTNEDNRIVMERFTGTATEMLGALRLVRSYGEERRVESLLEKSNQEAARSRLEVIDVSSRFGAFSWGSVQFLSLIVIAGGAILSIYDRVTPGTVLAFVAGLPGLMQPIQLFANMSTQYFLGREAYASICELLDEPEIEQWRGTQRLNPIRGQIEFDGVSFRYPNATRSALDGFSLSIAPGTRVALVGSSGAGKSTVASLLLGLYAPTAGTVRFDGISQADLDIRWLRKNTAIVMQESILLSGTVADNIRFARSDASDAQVIEAARRAQALDFIGRMPSGFDTKIGERGVMLSGGQRQRIAIARALLRDPSILIFDEPTSALDYESERLIQHALDDLVKGRTVITIAHRLSTIRDADLIVVMGEGRILEQGGFGELSARGGAFSRMLAAQEFSEDGDEPRPALAS